MDTEPIILLIDAASIDMSAAPDMDKSYFWNHHMNTKDDYLRLAEKIPDVTQSIILGVTEEKIKSDPNLRDTYLAYFDKKNMIQVNRNLDGSYSYSCDGRHRIAAACELGLEIPVIVINQI